MFARLGRLLDNYLPEIASGVGGLTLTVAGLSGLNPWEDGWAKVASSAPGITFLVGAALVLVGIVATIKRTQAVAPLKEELRKFQSMTERLVGLHYELCSNTLARISRETFDYGNTERITVYRHRGGNAFQVMGRHSEDPELKRRGRPIYPADQGVLGRAWREKVATADLPDPKANPDEYYRVLEDEWGISREVAEDFTMQSRSLVACTILEPKGIDPVAVVVVESTKVGILDKDEVVEAMRDTDGALLYEFFEMMKYLEPDVEYPRERGF
jgi:hypothetical protein